MKKSIYVILICFAFISCQNWLDLTPYDRIGEDDLFATEDGFQQALTGIYARMSKSDLYGMELSFGMADLLGQYWNIYAVNNRHYSLINYDYRHVDAESIINQVWYEMYKGIAETNNLLQALNAREESEFEQWKLLKGEALALRAFMHLELLEYFGPMNVAMSEQASIPYREEYSKELVPLLPGKEVFGKIKRDLKEAFVLLEDDPIRSIGHVSEYSILGDEKQENIYHNSFLDKRNIRMNYYAVEALLAKISLMEGNKQDAYKYAWDVIESGKFSLVDENDLVVVDSKKDLHYSDEIIFSLYMGKQQSICENYLGYGDEINYSYYFLPSSIDDIYTAGKGSTVDYRRSYWFNADELFIKYKKPADIDPAYQSEIPIIRLSELYYIAAEAQIEENDSRALELLNAVRENRNIGELFQEDITLNETILRHIVYDMRKDFWGEGKMFKTYKRLNMNILDGVSEIPASENIFVLPIPKEELEFGGN